jgi:hypothetical protein
MQFVFPALAGAFLLALLPLLIHVINLVRHQRVEWAAMEFLLASYKKHRRWVWLKQFLLMVSRIAIIALIVLMCAQWITQDQWLSLFAGKATHHYVLLDDSYSMSQRVGGSSAFDQARQVVASLAAEAAQMDTEHRLTVLRFSHASGEPEASAPGASEQGGGGAEEQGGTRRYAEQTDFNAETINQDLIRRLEDARQKWEPTELAIGPRGALEVLSQLVDPAANENHVIYLLSDFRAKDWEQSAEVRAALQELAKAKVDVQFIDCARVEEPNLAVTALATETDTKAAGVPMFVLFQVKNFGRTPVKRVQVKLRSQFYAPLTAVAPEPGAWQPKTEELPAVLIDEINPGETVSRRAQVYFPQAGRHVVEAQLPDDSVAADNVRRLVIDCPEGEQALVIDGSDEQQNAYYLAAAFHPLERSNTGVRADVKPASFLREATAETLRGYTSIYLLDVPRLDQRGVENLTRYVEEGGGLAIFAGENVDIAYYNDKLYFDGAGIMPLPIGVVADLPAPTEDDAPDFTVADHPLFAFFKGERNSFLAGVTISKFLPPRNDWQRDEKSTVQYLATLRGGKPLFVEKQLGQGRVIACLTTLAPQWNDWSKNPSFVVLALKLQSYLAASARPQEERLVGAPIRLELEATRYLPEVTVIEPSSQPDVTLKTTITAAEPTSGSPLLVADIGAAGQGDTDRSGIYEAWTTTVQGQPDVRRWALNVDPTEGNLAAADPAEVTQQLSPVKIGWQKSENVSYLAARQAGYNRSLLVMAVLLALMFGEQALAYSASYHVARPSVR